MSKPLTIDDAQQSLNTHAAAKGEELRERYGPCVGWGQLADILNDRSIVRYPCSIVFDAEPLQDGEFAHPVARGERPEDGFTICVHPRFASRLDSVTYLVLYQLVLVNYGEFASSGDAETFGAAALGMARDEYYDAICRFADEIAAAART